MQKNEPKQGYELNSNPLKLNKNKEIKENTENVHKEDDEYDKQRKFALSNRLEDQLKVLTGKLNENDIVLYGMVMCAPYSCITSYEYKIKITPGTSKRGR
eukprot:506065_1